MKRFTCECRFDLKLNWPLTLDQTYDKIIHEEKLKCTSLYKYKYIRGFYVIDACLVILLAVTDLRTGFQNENAINTQHINSSVWRSRKAKTVYSKICLSCSIFWTTVWVKYGQIGSRFIKTKQPGILTERILCTQHFNIFYCELKHCIILITTIKKACVLLYLHVIVYLWRKWHVVQYVQCIWILFNHLCQMCKGDRSAMPGWMLE